MTDTTLKINDVLKTSLVTSLIIYTLSVFLMFDFYWLPMRLYYYLSTDSLSRGMLLIILFVKVNFDVAITGIRRNIRTLKSINTPN